VVVLGLALWLPRLLLQFDPPAPYDEGNTVVAAWRVLEGERLYRDVWQMHPPGTAWALALAFRLLGCSLFTERLVKAVLLALVLALLHRITGRIAGFPLATAAVLLATLLPPMNPFLRPNDPAFAAGLLAALLVLVRGRLGRFASPAIGGTLGLCASFRLDFAAGSALAIAAFLALRGEWRRLPAVAASAAVAPTGVAAALAAQGLASDAWQQMFVFPATSYRAHRGMPVHDHVSVLLPAALCVAGVLAARAGLRRGADHGRNEALLLCGCLGLGYAEYAWARPDLEHSLPLRVLGLVAAAGLLVAAAGVSGRMRSLVARAVIVATVGLFAAPSASSLGAVARLASRLPEAPGSERVPAAGPLLRLDPDAAAVARLVRERTRPGAPIFVGNDRHDRILVNDVLMYFLADRRSVTRYYNLHPGLATREDVQREIVAALDRERVGTVVLWRAPVWHEPNASATPGAGVLDAALRARFEPREVRGRYALWERPESLRGAVSATAASGAR